MTRPEVWVTACIPTFRCTKYLRTAVTSLLDQTHSFLRVIVINDGDREPPWSVISDITDPRLLRFNLNENRGPYFSLAVALEATRDPFFLIQDADDWSAPHRVATLLRLLQRNRTNYAFSTVAEFHDGPAGAAILDGLRFSSEPDITATAKFRYRAPHHGLFQTKALKQLGGYFAGFKFGYDLLLTNLLLLVGSASWTPDRLYWRRLRASSLTRSPDTGLKSATRQSINDELEKLYALAYRDYKEFVARRISGRRLLQLIRSRIESRRGPVDSHQIQAQAALLRQAMAEQARLFSRSQHSVTAFTRRKAPANLLCPVCERSAPAFRPFGHIPRKNALCPNCRSLERHRLVWLFFQRRTDLFTSRRKRFLHLAPERGLSQRLRAAPNLSYLSADLNTKGAMVRMDITRIEFPNEYFDVIYCSHVLEHVPDDRRAMRELCRVLAPAGWAVFMVPITAPATSEDPRILSPCERERAFGQPDHVRRYGPDFQRRLGEAGFRVRRIRPLEVVTDEEMRLMAIHPLDDIFFCVR